MTTRRALKAAEAIREVVSMSILTELRDPRIENVTVTYVEVAADFRQAKVHVSVMGDESQQQRSLIGLQNAAGFLQQKIARRMDTRYTPRLRFVLDQGVKNALEVDRILKEVLPQSAESENADPQNPPQNSAQADGASRGSRRPPELRAPSEVEKPDASAFGSDQPPVEKPDASSDQPPENNFPQ